MCLETRTTTHKLTVRVFSVSLEAQGLVVAVERDEEETLSESLIKLGLKVRQIEEKRKRYRQWFEGGK